MARRRSARSEPDLDGEDDEFAWQPKKSPKKKKKKGTGRTSRNSGSSDTHRSSKRKRTKTGSTRSAKSTGSRKTSGSSINRSGRKKKSRRASADDEDMGSSARRRRSGRTPPRKKQGASPVVLISIISAAVLVCLIIVAYSATRPTKIVVDNPARLQEADDIASEGMDLFREWNKLKDQGHPGQDAKNKESHAKLTEAMDIYNEVLAPYRDADDQLPAKYEGYEAPMQQIAIYLVDLEKGARTK